MINQRKKNCISGRIMGRTGRIAALLLIFAMFISILPGEAFAADWVRLNPTQNTTASAGKKFSSNYILEVSSGSRAKGTVADNVLYFVVSYTTGTGTAQVERSAIIMPNVDGISNGLAVSDAIGNRNSRIDYVSETFGYELFGRVDRYKALGSVQTDQFLFETPEEITGITGIQIFGKRSPSTNEWTCQGMRIYRADTIYGTEMYGWYSNQPYIDFSGQLIAEVQMGKGAGIFHWETSGGMFNLKSYGTSGFAGAVVVDINNKEAYEADLNTTTNVGKMHFTQTTNPVVIRLDLADTGDAGFESLAGSYEAGSESKVSQLGFCETSALQVRYLDIYGCSRDVYLPLIINSLGPVVEKLGDVAIAGYAQQGDTIAVPAMLPDYKEIQDIAIILGEKEAQAESNITINNSGAPVRNERKALTEDDSISYTCIAVYDNVEANVTLDGATIRYSFVPGDNNPVKYNTASSVEGVNFEAKSGQNTFKGFNLQNYNEYITLKPVDRLERYLVTISTDNVVNAGTESDLKIQFSYISIKDKELESPMYSVKDYVQMFYGEWPGNVSDFAYKYGLRQGGTVQFIVPLQGVKQFTGVRFKLDGEDEWQFSGVSIAMVKPTDGNTSYVDSRVASWEEIQSSELEPNTTNPKYMSHLRYTRAVKTQDVCFSIGNVYDPTETQPVPDENWKPGTLIQDDGNTTEFNGQGSPVSTKEEIDWESVRRSITYEQTKQNFAFTKERCNYLVTVKVKGDLVNPAREDDDAGSKNLFYFQLVFENGKSGCTLANQQIQGDAFRTGDECQFYIPTSQDYGDLTSIMVIPDNQDGNSDIYDKLKIEWITVEKETTDALSPTWTASSDSDDGLGWVGIDYRDPGEYSSYRGAKGHTASELATVYQITESSYNAKFLVSITTGNYGQTRVLDSTGKSILVNDEVFSGGISMSYHYFDTDGVFQFKKGIDVIELINKYTGRTGSKSRTVEYDNAVVTEDVDYYVSDPNYNFRAGTTDNFFITVKDIYEFTDLQLQLRSNVVTNWNIQDINISLVNGTGRRFINANGEYDYAYPEGMEPTFITTWTRGESLTKDVQVFRTDQNNSLAEVKITLKESPISISADTGKWTTVVPREPNSRDDTFNLFLYPQATEEATDPSKYTMTAAVRYTNVLTKLPMQTSTGPMRRYTDDDGNTVFYAVGLGANNMEAFSGVDIKASSLTEDITAPVAYGVLQRVRGGVLIDSYYLTYVVNAGLGGSMYADVMTHELDSQKLVFQMSPDIKTQTLEAESKDMAIALFFKGDDPSDLELRSKFIYLTDLGIKQISPAQIIEMDFDLGNVSDITGVYMVALGGLDARVENLYAADLSSEGKLEFTRSIQGKVNVTDKPAKYGFSGDVGLLTLALDTAGDESSIHSGTQDPISMKLGYYDTKGVLRSYSVDDIRAYVTEGGGFAAGSTDVLSILVPEMAELRYVELEPKSSDPNGMASWKLDKLTATVGLDGRSITRSYGQLIVQGKPAHIGMADIMLSGLVYDGSGSDSVPSEAKSVATGESLSMLLNSGRSIRIAPSVFGSSSGFYATIENYDPSTGATSNAELGVTYSYTESYLKELLSSARRGKITSRSASEQAAATQVENIITTMMESAGSFKYDSSSVNFTAPRNYTGRDLNYRITVRSTELNDIFFTVDVKVYSETDQLSTAVSLWKNEEAANNAAESGSSGSGGSSSSTPASSGEGSGSSGSSESTTGSAIETGDQDAASQEGGSSTETPSEGGSSTETPSDSSSSSEPAGSSSTEAPAESSTEETPSGTEEGGE